MKVEASATGLCQYISLEEWERRPGNPAEQAELTEEVTQAICQAVMNGAKPSRAATLAGLSRSTWWRARKWADEGREPWAMRVGLIRLAEASCLAASEARIQMAAKGGEWKADQWLLETRDRKTYGKTSTTTIKRDGRDVAEISTEELMRIVMGEQ